MAAQKQDDQHERTFSSYVRIRDVVLKTYLGRWTIGRSGERGSGISVLPARGRWTIGRSGERGSGISVLPARYDDDDEHFTKKEIIHHSTKYKVLLDIFDFLEVFFVGFEIGFHFSSSLIWVWRVKTNNHGIYNTILYVISFFKINGKDG